MATDKNPVGRPRIVIDEERVELLARAFSTNAEIAAMLGINVDTLADNFSVPLKKGRDAAKGSLRAKQYARAMEGSDTMLIWLGKQYLDQKDKSDLTSGGQALGVIGYDITPPRISANQSEDTED